MQRLKHNYLIILINILLFFILFIFHYTDLIDISIKNATPLLFLPLITAFAIFNSLTASAFAGLLIGIMMDSASNGMVAFNAIVMLLIAVFVSVFSNNLFNKNIQSAILITVIVSLFYFVLRWLVFYAFTVSVRDNLYYLLSYVFPSVIYTDIFIFPFYFLYKYFNKIENNYIP